MDVRGLLGFDFKNKDGMREVFDTSCENKTLEFTCEFSGPVTEAMGGIPFVCRYREVISNPTSMFGGSYRYCVC